MLKNKNNFEIINLFFHWYVENFSEHARIALLPEQAYKMLHYKKHWIWGSYYSACWGYKLQCSGM
jgi:hypothetical protein